jgi:hypothetical protein
MNYNELRQPIIIEQGIFRNFTGRYLLPQLKIMGNNLLDKLDGRYVSAFALCDRKYHKYNEFDNKLFIVMSIKAELNYWMDYYEYYMYQDEQTDKMVVILDLPINNRAAFLEGRYSELYKDDENIIPKFTKVNGIDTITSAWAVVNKTDQAREAFENKVNKDFGLNPKILITKEQEYEYPLVMDREILNYK